VYFVQSRYTPIDYGMNHAGRMCLHTPPDREAIGSLIGCLTCAEAIGFKVTGTWEEGSNQRTRVFLVTHWLVRSVCDQIRYQCIGLKVLVFVPYLLFRKKWRRRYCIVTTYFPQVGDFALLVISYSLELVSFQI